MTHALAIENISLLIERPYFMFMSMAFVGPESRT